MVLAKFSFREVFSRPGRATLTLLSIVIGVAAVVSVSIATTTTRRAYQDMSAAVSGRAALEVAAEGAGGFDEGLVAQIEEIPGVKVAAPIVQRLTNLYAKGRKVRLAAMGVDPIKDTAVRDYEVKEGRFVDEGGGIVLEAGFAQSINVQLGDRVKFLDSSAGLRTMPVVGLIVPRGAISFRLAGMIFMPLKQAQRFFAGKGRVDRIQVVLGDSASPQAVSEEIASLLPVGISVRPPAGRTQLLEETLRSSEEGLRLATAFSILLATFIIFNTFLMNVGERRQKLAIMRAVGATRRQISRMLLGESLVLGVVGTVLGILLGLAGAYLLTTALNQLLLASLPSMCITATPFILAVVFGLGISLVGAVVPARRAGRVTPLEGMSAVPHEDIEGHSHKFTWVGSILSLASGSVLLACILGWLPIDLAVVSAVFLLLGIVLLVQTVLSGLSRLVVWLISPVLRVESHLAHRQILRHRTRSALTIGVLFIAISTGIGLASAILDNVRDVRDWYRRAIVGDFFIRATMPDFGTGMAPNLPPPAVAEVKKIPGITNLDTAKFKSPVHAAGLNACVIAREFKADAPVYFDLKGGDRNEVRNRLHQGEVVVSTVLAQRTGLDVGDELPIETRQGPQRLRIAGLTNDYLAGGLTIFMERKVAERLLDIEGEDACLIQADPQAREEVKAQLQKICDQYGLLLLSFADVSRMIDGMIKGIDGCLWGILVLGFIVASFGVVNTLTMNVLEQTRELGLLRIVAMTRWQVRKTILTQAAIIGSIGLVPGTAAGLGVAYLINRATMPTTGHPVEFAFHPLLLLGSFLAAFAMVVLAAWGPAERAARLELRRALQYE
jgi:putative ABC transport system permease protein